MNKASMGQVADKAGLGVLMEHTILSCSKIVIMVFCCAHYKHS